MTLTPDMLLSTGRIVKHSLQPNGSQRAIPTPGPDEMTNAEWLEYCVNRVPKLKTAAALRAMDFQEGS